jgi:hypothetical protein
MKRMVDRLIQAVKSCRLFRRTRHFEWKVEVLDN